MAVIKEVIETIDFWSPPLKKRRYFMSGVQRRAFVSSGTGSGILMEEVRRRDREASGILQEGSATMSGWVDPYAQPVPDGEILHAEEASPDAEPPKRKFRALKRIEELVFDDTAIKQGELEDEAYDVLNEDGFYDEILPVDFDEDVEIKRDLPIKEVLFYTAALLGTIGFMIWVILRFVL